MKTPPLGQIKKVTIREIFSDEARDFTPWLAKEENLAILSGEIGVDIKLLQIEANVGRFNVDILAVENGTDRRIIIENQFNNTDHDHLGKLITYASGHDAKTIVWIFEEIREEHRQAIEWLNENTIEDLDFFAISIQLWKIDNSNPAPKFEIIVKPNEWTKAIRNTDSVELSDTKLQQLEFWTQLKQYASESYKTLRLQKPLPQHWYNLALGSSEAHLVLTINTREEQLGCEVYINDNKDLFHYLKGKQKEIESKLDVKLDWIEAKKACRIKASKDGFVISEQDNYKVYFEWLLGSVVRFQKQFSDEVKAFVESQE